MRVDRSELVVGKKYYIDNRKDIIGTLVYRNEGSLYFDCGEQDRYTPSNIREGLIPFHSVGGDGFDEVLIGDDLTDENLELIESILEDTKK